MSEWNRARILCVFDDLLTADRVSDLEGLLALSERAGYELDLVLLRAEPYVARREVNVIAVGGPWLRLAQKLRERDRRLRASLIVAVGPMARALLPYFGQKTVGIALERRFEPAPHWAKIATRLGVRPGMRTFVANFEQQRALAAESGLHENRMAVGHLLAAPLRSAPALRRAAGPLYGIECQDATALGEPSLLEAMTILRRYVAEAELVVFGREPRGASRPSGPGVRWIDAEDVARVWPHLDAFLFDAKTPGLSAWRERAHERGLPVIALEGTGEPRAAMRIEGGAYCIPRHPASFLADALHELALVDGLAEQLSEASRTEFEKGKETALSLEDLLAFARAGEKESLPVFSWSLSLRSLLSLF